MDQEERDALWQRRSELSLEAAKAWDAHLSLLNGDAPLCMEPVVQMGELQDIYVSMQLATQILRYGSKTVESLAEGKIFEEPGIRMVNISHCVMRLAQIKEKAAPHQIETATAQAMLEGMTLGMHAIMEPRLKAIANAVGIDWETVTAGDDPEEEDPE